VYICQKYDNWLEVDKVIATISRLTFFAPPCMNVDDLIHEFEDSYYGCAFGKLFGCIMFADDLLLLSASVAFNTCSIFVIHLSS